MLINLISQSNYKLDLSMQLITALAILVESSIRRMLKYLPNLSIYGLSRNNESFFNQAKGFYNNVTDL